MFASGLIHTLKPKPEAREEHRCIIKAPASGTPAFLAHVHAPVASAEGIRSKHSASFLPLLLGPTVDPYRCLAHYAAHSPVGIIRCLVARDTIVTDRSAKMGPGKGVKGAHKSRAPAPSAPAKQHKGGKASAKLHGAAPAGKTGREEKVREWERRALDEDDEEEDESEEEMEESEDDEGMDTDVCAYLFLAHLMPFLGKAWLVVKRRVRISTARRMAESWRVRCHGAGVHARVCLSVVSGAYLCMLCSVRAARNRRTAG